MDLLVQLGRLLGFSFAAGINLYATVALLGLASRYGWVTLPPQYQAFNSDLVIYTAAIFYLVEFLTDKIPWVDTAWDTIHTFIRPVGGALIAITALGHATPTVTALAALLGGVVAGSTHLTKAGTRAIVNTSPEPFSNWALSLGEDVFVVGLGMLALKYPVIALAVTVALLALIAVFAATILRGVKRWVARRRAGRVAGAVLLAVGIAALTGGAGHAQQPPPPTPAAQAGAAPAPGQPPPQPPPVFRGGANFVRVDMYATKDGVPIQDLAPEEIEVLEDGAPQKIETFEHVVVRGGGPQAERVEPRTIAEGNQMAADPRSRVFILFLDVYHVKMGSARAVQGPLVRLLDRVIGPDDLVAVMTPQMSAADITFTRRPRSIAQMLLNMPFWGARDAVTKKDEIEQRYEYCYPPDPGTEPGYSTSTIAQEMIERRRERLTLDALEEIVRHLDGLREERKAILTVTEGWRLFRENRALAEMQRPTPPGIFVGPNGRLTSTDTRDPIAGYMAECDRDRMMLAQMDDDRRFRDFLDEANRANASFYPIDPRGLPVFDSDMGPNPPPPPSVDMANLQDRLTSLRTLAGATDGIAVVNSNDIERGVARVVADLSSYYLLGYASTNAKLDGRFRSIKVRVRRPGVEVRARRGYKAPTEAEVAARTLASAAAASPAESAPIDRAIGTLDAIRGDALFHLYVASGWWRPAADAPTAQAGRAEPALWVVGEIDPRRATGDDWTKGAEANVSIATEQGDGLASFNLTVPPGAGRFVARFPRNADDVWLDPGKYLVRVRVRPVAGGLSTTDTVRFSLLGPPPVARPVLGEPIYSRRGPATGMKDQPTSDLRFRRTERVAVEVTLSDAFESTSAELLDRKGRPIEVPVTVSTREEAGVRWLRAEVSLAPLTAGDYVVRLTARTAGQQEQALAPFRIVP